MTLFDEKVWIVDNETRKLMPKHLTIYTWDEVTPAQMDSEARDNQDAYFEIDGDEKVIRFFR